ncbi:MAG: ATP-binding protein, partial [Desulfarculaceae bacterium]
MSLAPTATGVKSMPAKTGKPLDLSVRLAGNFPPQGVILVGVSGGGDSVGLLRLLAQMAPERGWRLVAAHVDHRLRSGSARDGRFVRDLAQKLGTGFDLRRVKVEAGGSSPEQAARSARYKA